MKKPIKRFLIFLLLIAATAGWLYWENNALQVSQYTVESAKLPKSFDGLRIAHVSDLQNAQFGTDNRRLLELLHQSQPDIIVITGDLIDSRRTNCNAAINFVREAVKIAPCYYVLGNHESRIKDRAYLEAGLWAAGATVLRNSHRVLRREDQSIRIAGLDDPTFSSPAQYEDNLAALMPENSGFTVLLSHRPEKFSLYSAYGVDLALCGHAHGGQIRLPWIGPLFAPHQGWFPPYTAGVYTQSGTAMAVSRGLGNSLFPFRINNRPELVVITLKAI